MNKHLATTVLCFMVIAIVGGWLLSKSYRKAIIKHQQETIQAQKAHKESLRKEAEYLERLNSAFDKAYEIERPVTVMDPPDPKPLEIKAGVKE